MALCPNASAPRMGRMTAIARSSNTSTDNTIGVSLLQTQPRSNRTLATPPDDEMYVTPPRNSDVIRPYDSARPATNPGMKLATRSTIPVTAPERRLAISSDPVYSRPSMSSSSTTPRSAPTSMNSSEVTTGTRPPSPKASPPMRYSGMGESPMRRASAARAASRSTTPPSSRNNSAASRMDQPTRRILVTVSMPSAVPTTTRVSPGSIKKSGPGAGNATSPLRTATTETPVRVRIRASPIFLPAYGPSVSTTSQ